ncbi:MAG: ribonuclease D [Deltaproteobacteria bacterium]|nr:ribonuclease D [Deltaproteobacteria bacterium]
MFGDFPLVLVSDRPTLLEVAAKLARCNAIGVDTESDSFYHYQEKVCLLQISDADADYVIDPLALRQDLSPLNEVMADASITKIFHGADYDVVCLKRDFSFEIHGIFDTLVATQLLGRTRFGLADLIERYFGYEVDKTLQRHNWAQRPLEYDHLDYARGDTHFLRALREILLRDLAKANRLKRFEEECRLLERRQWQGRGFDPDGWLKAKGTITLDDDGKRVLRRAWAYRDEQARGMDRPQFKVMPDDILIALADVRPESEAELDKVISPRSGLRRRHGRAMLKIVQDGLDDRTPLATSQRVERPKGPKPRLTGRLAEKVVVDLRTWRNARGKDASTAAFTIASNGTLKAIAANRPTSLAELAAISEVRAWQVEEFGEEILDVLQKSDPRK